MTTRTQPSSPVTASDLVYDLISATQEHERRSGDKYYRIQFEEAREAVLAALARPAQRTSIAEFADAELRSELHRRAQDFLGDPTKGVSFPADWEQDKAETSRLPRPSAVTSTQAPAQTTISPEYADAANIAYMHGHHALWHGLLDYGWDEKTEKFGRGLAYRISDAIKSKIKSSTVTSTVQQPVEKTDGGAA